MYNTSIQLGAERGNTTHLVEYQCYMECGPHDDARVHWLGGPACWSAKVPLWSREACDARPKRQEWKGWLRSHVELQDVTHNPRPHVCTHGVFSLLTNQTQNTSLFPDHLNL